MTTPRIRPDMGSLSSQLDALDQFLLETADEVGAVRTENRRLRERIVALAAEVAGLRDALQSGGMLKSPAPVPAAGKRRLSLISGAR